MRINSPHDTSPDMIGEINQEAAEIIGKHKH